MQTKISLGAFQLKPCSVRLEGQPELADWKGPLEFALWCQRASPWWIGDMINLGEDRHGESFSQVCQGVVSTEMLSRYASVARRVPADVRRPNLSWSAHAAVARLPHHQQKRYLRLAEENGWSSEELRKRVRRAQQA